MSKWITRIVATIIIAIGAIAVYVELNKENIAQRFIDTANESLTEPLVVESYDVSFLSTFPSISVALRGVSISDLLAVDELRGDIHLWEIIRNRDSGMQIGKITISDGRLNLITHRNGSTNYDIVKSSEATDPKAEKSFINININSYEINDIDLSYRDQVAGSSWAIDDLSAKGQINVKADQVDVTSDMSATAKASMLDIPLALTGNIILQIIGGGDQLKVEKGNLKINQLPLILDGTASADKNGWAYSGSFSAPSTDVKEILSLLPNVYQSDYTKAVSSGSYTVSGSLSGHTSHDYPTYDIKASIADGALRYPTLPTAIDHIGMDIHLQNASPKTPYSLVDIKNLLLNVGQSKLSGAIKLDQKNNGVISVDTDSDVNLSDIYSALQWPELQGMSGTIKGQVKANIKQDELTSSVLDVDLAANDIELKYADKTSTLEQLSITGTDKELLLKTEQLDYPGIQIKQLEAQLSDVLRSALSETPIKGNVTADIARISVDEFLSDTDTVSTTSNHTNIPELSISADVSVQDLTYTNYQLKGITGKGMITDGRSSIDYDIQSVNGNAIKGSAKLDSLLQYGMSDATLSGTVDVHSPHMILDSLMSSDETASGDSTSSPLPERMDLDINYTSDRVEYAHINLTKAIGTVSLEDQQLVMEHNGDFLGGNIYARGTLNMTGSEPHIQLDAGLEEVSFGETAQQIAFFSKLVPVASLLKGQYNTSINWDSKLTGDFFPVLESLSALGRLKTKEGATMALPAVDSLLMLSGIVMPENSPIWQLDNLSRYFKIENGRVIVPQMRISRDGVDFLYKGSHGFDQQIDYQVSTVIPKEKIDLSKLIDKLPDDISSNDFLLKLTDNADVELVMRWTGHIYRPKIKIVDVRLRKGSITESIKETIKDEVDKQTEQVKDSVETIIATVEDTIAHYEDLAKETIDTVKVIAQNEWDSTKVAVEETAQTVIDSLMTGNIDSIGREIEDLLKGQQNRLKDWKDIFKKKKKSKKSDN